MASKRYREAQAMIDKTKRYELGEALNFLKSFPKTKFDETVEVHMNLGVDPRKADQQIRNSLVLPHGSGKSMRVLVFAEGDKAEEAKTAGADYVGVDEFVEKIQSGWMEFDVAIATPNLMGKIGRLGRVLGPRGLMPNPKVGTVTMDVANAVSDSKGGKVTYRVDKFSNLHIIAGKLSFDVEKLKENILAIISAIIRERPAALKGVFIKSIAVTSTMGPGIKLDVALATTESKQ
ncbi:MAG: 50S ribosomal protein L1 [Candidatus Cloacimonadales bacterium]|nr:50S ribosomal protein L1 [Candidatus Cloacimonadales bacterium]